MKKDLLLVVDGDPRRRNRACKSSGGLTKTLACNLKMAANIVGLARFRKILEETSEVVGRLAPSSVAIEHHRLEVAGVPRNPGERRSKADPVDYRHHPVDVSRLLALADQIDEPLRILGPLEKRDGENGDGEE